MPKFRSICLTHLIPLIPRMIQFATDTHRNFSAITIRHYDERRPALVDSSPTDFMKGEISRQAGDTLVTNRRRLSEPAPLPDYFIKWKYGQASKKFSETRAVTINFHWRSRDRAGGGLGNHPSRHRKERDDAALLTQEGNSPAFNEREPFLRYP